MEAIQLDDKEEITMDQQLDLYNEKLEQVKSEMNLLWAKLEAIELITKGLRGKK